MLGTCLGSPEAVEVRRGHEKGDGHCAGAGGSGADGEADQEGGGGDEEWLMAGRTKRKKAVTRGTTSVQARACTQNPAPGKP